MKQLLTIGLLGLTLLLNACGGEKFEVEIQPKGNLMQYTVTEFTVSPGSKVTITMNNTATVPVMKHNVVVLKTNEAIKRLSQYGLLNQGEVPDNDADILAATPMADPQMQTSITFTAPNEPGHYTYICTYPGHSASMQGVMIVE